MNIKKTNIITTEKIILTLKKLFKKLVQSSTKREIATKKIRRKLRLGRAATKKLEKILNCRAVFVDGDQDEVNHAIVFPITIYGCEES